MLGQLHISSERYFWEVEVQDAHSWDLETGVAAGKGDQSWVFIGRTDVEAETPNLKW